MEVEFHKEVKELLFDAEKQEITGVKLTNGKSLFAQSVVIATGGISYPQTGSTGDGYDFAKQVGHTVTDLAPALVPMNMKEEDCKKMQGLSLRNIGFLVKRGKKVLYEDFGELLFTHFGISGPVVLSASSHFPAKPSKEETIVEIDLKPALSEEQLDARLLRDFEAYRGRQFKNCLDKLLPAKMIPIIIERSQIDPQKKVNVITKEERRKFAELIQKVPLTVTGTRGFEEAIITSGGVRVQEVNPSTMESKLVKGLYFAGEMLDVDALTGGFNLQIAWSSGHLAGQSAGADC